MITLDELTRYLDDYSVVIVENGKLRSATFVEQLVRLVSTKLKTKQTLDVLAFITKILHEAKRVTPKTAFCGRDVFIIKEWLLRNQRILSDHRFQAALKHLKTELTAYRLGITVANMDASPGLQEFSEQKAFLHNYLAFYRHTLQTLDENSPVRIMLEGKYVDWTIAKAEIVDAPDVKGIWPRKYGPKGLINSDFGVWEDPHPRAYHTPKHPAPGKYLFSYCVFSSWLSPRFTGEHSWFRLTTPEGLVYEFGKYRPPKIWSLTKALLNYPATIQSPDMTTMWPVAPKNTPPVKHTDGLQITEIHFEISKHSFEKALEKITEIKRQDELTFGLFDDSCVVMVNEVARECGIDIDTSASMLKLVLIKLRVPLKWVEKFNKLQASLPPVLVNILYFIPAVLTNIVLCFIFGARKRYKPGGKRHIDSLWDILDPKKSTLHHPWYLSTIIRNDVEANRPKGQPFGIPKKFDMNQRSH